MNNLSRKNIFQNQWHLIPGKGEFYNLGVTKT